MLFRSDALLHTQSDIFISGSFPVQSSTGQRAAPQEQTGVKWLAEEEIALLGGAYSPN